MARKKKGRSRTTTSNRMDYRTGGRVGYQPGGRVPGEPTEEELQRNIEDREEGGTSSSVLNQVADTVQDSVTSQDSETPTTPEKTPEQIERDQKAQQTLIQSVEGKVPDAAKIPDAIPVGIDPETGKPIQEQQVTTMAAPTTVAETQIEGVAPEQVTKIEDTAQVQRPEDVTAAQIEPVTVDTDAQVDVAEGQVSDESIAQAAGVERVEPIEAAKVDIPEGALQERVVGELSPEAKAEAAKIAGSNLGRVTRAKKQLRTAGVSENIIAELGNDPEALELALMDIPESERGVIEGLPEEALVSNQLDSLLTGIENGEIPAWAQPAVTRVEEMLAARGLSASSVGRAELTNAIIQSAIPLAQSNAQAIQAAISQERTLETQVNIRQAELKQQTALQNAQNVFSLDMAQFSADQQRAINNSKFLQTVGLTEANNEQQSIIQNAVLMSQANLAEADFNTRLSIQNAQAFLQMDMANLNNQQQANVLKAQQEQQRILSNQSAQNAAAQFNATSENQINQFMANLAAQAEQFNVAQMNATAQFNTSQVNAAAARDAQREADLNKANAQLKTQIAEFNANQDFARNQWNAQNAAAVEASNVSWRRQANTVNTAAQNAINQQNAQNAFNLSNASMAFLWQELRDDADYLFRSTENKQNRIASLLNTALASDPDSYSNTGSIKDLISTIIGDVV